MHDLNDLIEVTEKQKNKIAQLCEQHKLNGKAVLAELIVNPLLNDTETGSLDNSISLYANKLYIVILTDGSSHT